MAPQKMEGRQAGKTALLLIFLVLAFAEAVSSAAPATVRLEAPHTDGMKAPDTGSSRQAPPAAYDQNTFLGKLLQELRKEHLTLLQQLEQKQKMQQQDQQQEQKDPQQQEQAAGPQDKSPQSTPAGDSTAADPAHDHQQSMDGELPSSKFGREQDSEHVSQKIIPNPDHADSSAPSQQPHPEGPAEREGEQEARAAPDHPSRAEEGVDGEEQHRSSRDGQSMQQDSGHEQHRHEQGHEPRAEPEGAEGVRESPTKSGLVSSHDDGAADPSPDDAHWQQLSQESYQGSVATGHNNEGTHEQYYHGDSAEYDGAGHHHQPVSSYYDGRGHAYDGVGGGEAHKSSYDSEASKESEEGYQSHQLEGHNYKYRDAEGYDQWGFDEQGYTRDGLSRREIISLLGMVLRAQGGAGHHGSGDTPQETMPTGDVEYAGSRTAETLLQEDAELYDRAARSKALVKLLSYLRTYLLSLQAAAAAASQLSTPASTAPLKVRALTAPPSRDRGNMGFKQQQQQPVATTMQQGEEDHAVPQAAGTGVQVAAVAAVRPELSTEVITVASSTAPRQRPDPQVKIQ